MIVRRIREHVTTHNWFAVAIDLAIVVLGVFLGTQANNWNEARVDREKAHHYRQRLIADLNDNEADVRNVFTYFTQVRGHALAALAVLDKPDRPLDARAAEQFLIDASQAAQLRSSSPKRFTFNTITSSGDLGLLGDLAAPLGDHYMRLGEVVAQTSLGTALPPYRERLRRELPYDIEVTIRAACHDLDADDVIGDYRLRLPKTCDPALTTEQLARGLARLRTAPELDRDLSRWVNYIDRTLAAAQAHISSIRTIRPMVERSDQ